MSERPLILVVDDDQDVRDSLRRLLDTRFDVETADGGQPAIELLDEGVVPDLVLLDVRMPGGPDGYEVCAWMQEREELAWIPVVFVTVLDSEKDKERALAVGGAAYLEKPFESEELLAAVEEHLGTQRRWRELQEGSRRERSRDFMRPRAFNAFKRYIAEERGASEEEGAAVEGVGPDEVYTIAEILGISEEQVARYIARFLELSFVDRILADDAALGRLPRTFCKSNLVVPLQDDRIILANPFDWELTDVLQRTLWRGAEPEIAISDPVRIGDVFEGRAVAVEGDARHAERVIALEDDSAEDVASGMEIANEILRAAISEGASDVHVEPKEDGAHIRFRIDGDMHAVRTIDRESGARVVSRLKALAGMDIAQKRKPQDGAAHASLGDRRFKLRLATSSTANGETLVVRILEPDADPVPLEELGMGGEQADALRGAAERRQGMILVVGPTGSGKSTTIFTLLSHVDGTARSIMSVEDPVEYTIRDANQQQVNEKAGVTFEALLKSAMRQDPDILFLGEVRDSFSAKAVLDFASSGHLTVSTLHASNATSAIFRMERLDVDRGAIADAVSVVVAQRLLKTLCEECREVGPPTDAESEMLAPFIEELPDEVARPVGCPACRETGYSGRTGVHEVVTFGADVTKRVREGASAAEVRRFLVDRGDDLLPDRAIAKVRELLLPVVDVHREILLEEIRFRRTADDEAGEEAGEEGGDDSTTLALGRHLGRERAEERAASSAEGGTGDEGTGGRPGGGAESGTEAGGEGPEVADAGPEDGPIVLVVDDDPDLSALLELHLTQAGYRVILAGDGVDALMALGSREIDAVISDVNMPNLDGERLMEMMSQKGVDVPALFMTAEEDDELESRLLGSGAADFIQKPIKEDVLLLRLGNVLPGGGGAP